MDKTTGAYHGDNKNVLLYDLEVSDANHTFSHSIQNEMEKALLEKETLESQLNENLEQLRLLTPECDKLDYALAVSSGALCGVLDIFFVAKPGESSFSNITDKWFEERTKDFAKLNGWNGEGGLSSAVRKLENVFKIPYDQTGMKEAGLQFLGLDMKNHRFKSLGHNPSILGLFFSVLDQFGDQEGSIAHYVANGDLIIWKVPDGQYELRGKTIPAKLFSAVVNWFGHLISDMSGSSVSKGRGMGIPSPLWTWTNDIIAIKRTLKIEPTDFDKHFNQIALDLYAQGYDTRYQTAQAIPVFINEMTVRLLYSVRRMIRYYSVTAASERTVKACWEACEPFSNATVKRMLTVAHGTFCLIDTGDAFIRGAATGAGTFNVTEFFMRLNIIGIGRFTVSLYGEAERSINAHYLKKDVSFLNKEKMLVDEYIRGLERLSQLYDDRDLVNFVDDFKNSDCYKEAFMKSVELARLRGVPEEKIIKTKAEGDAYFLGGGNGKKEI